MSKSEQRIATETALELLTNQQRRQILRRVADAPDGTTVDQLTQHLGGADSLRSDGNGSAEGIELHHVHLPKLREASVIEYDTDRGSVRRGREFQAVLGLLKAIDDHREDTSTSVS
jgi:DNA-binding transcriptional ArsR family regulator